MLDFHAKPYADSDGNGEPDFGIVRKIQLTINGQQPIFDNALGHYAYTQ